MQAIKYLEIFYEVLVTKLMEDPDFEVKKIVCFLRFNLLCLSLKKLKLLYQHGF